MLKTKNAICRGCGKSYERSSGIRGRYCSSACKVEYPKSKKACKPDCSLSTLYIRAVTFKNGTIHTQQCCKMCLKSVYIPRGSTTLENFKAVFKHQAEIRKERYGDVFYSDREWTRLRYQTLKKYGPRCMCCGSTDGKMHVDHIKPKSKYPHLALDEKNLQVLCLDCNMGKSNTDETDWRPK